MRLLLDINVWVALVDDAHIRNGDALKLFGPPGLSIASCALTENRVLRVLYLPGYARRARAGQARAQRECAAGRPGATPAWIRRRWRRALGALAHRP